MRNLFWVRNFWYESNERLTKDFKEGARVKKSLDSITHISLDNPPKFLEEENRDAIKSRSFVRTHLENCLFYLLIGYAYV